MKKSREFCKLIPAVVLAVGAMKASGQEYYEPFNYGTTGVPLALNGNPGMVNPMSGFNYYNVDGGTNFANPPGLSLTSGSLATPSYVPAASGDSLTYSNPGNLVQAPRIKLQGGQGVTGATTVYYSLMFRVNSIATVSTNGGFLAAFHNAWGPQTGSVSGNTAGELSVKLNPNDPTHNTYVLGVVAPAQSATSAAWDTTGHAAGDLLQVVVGMTLSTQTANLWVNPPQADLGRGTEPPDPTVTDITFGGVIGSIDSFYYRVANSANPNLTLDEVRVDTSWAGVTPISNASNPTWTGSSGGLWSGNNWGGNASPNAGSTFVYFGPSSSGNVSVDSNVTVGTMNFNGTAGYNITGPATITFDGARAGVDTVGALVQAAINVQPVISAGVPQAASHTISSNIMLASNTTSLHVNTGVNQTLTLSGSIGETTAGSTVVKSGGGVLALTGSNNTTGGITVNDGTLRIDPAGNGLGTSNLALFGGILELTSSTPFTRDVGSGGDQVQLVTSNVLNGVLSYAGFSAFGANAVVDLGGALAQVTWSATGTSGAFFRPNALVLNGTTATGNIDFQNPISIQETPGGTVTVNAQTATMSGAISGNTLTKTGSGILLLSNAGNNNSGVTVGAGLLRFTAAGAFTGMGGGIQVNSGGAVSLDTGALSSTLIGKIKAASASVGSLALTSNDAGGNINFTLDTGNNGEMGNAATVAMSIGAVGAVNYTGTITPPTSGSNANTYALGGGPGTLIMANTNAITGAGKSLRITNGGTVQLASTNDYTGNTTIDSGSKLIFNSGGSLGSAASQITINGATLEYGSSTNIGNHPIALDTTNGGTISQPNGYQDNGYGGTISGGTLTYSGSPGSFFQFSGSGGMSSLTVKGGGTWRANSETNLGVGPIILDGGVLATNTAITNSSHSFTVTANGGTFGGPFDQGNLILSNAVTGAGTLTKSGTHSSTFGATSYSLSGVNVTGGTLQVNSGSNSTSVVTSVTINGGTMDLTSNRLVTSTAVGTFSGGSYTANSITRYIHDGVITSSTAAAQGGLTTLGVSTGANVKGLSGAQTATWGGQTVHATDTLVMYTYAGDATLDGQITGDDYFRIDQGFASHSTGYDNGDFNLDGKINADDYFIIDSNYGRQTLGITAPAPPLNGVAAVPEPTGLALLSAAAVGLFARRRRR